MTTDKSTSSQKICPTCGTRLSENATRCLVCGRIFTTTATPKRESDSSVQGPRMPTLSLSLPLAIGLFILLVGIGAGGVYFFAKSNTQIVIPPTPAPTATQTPTTTLTPTPTATGTPQPTWTPLPTLEYIVKQNDSCNGIAALLHVSPNVIILANNLPADCTLRVGQKLGIPQPTQTATSVATSTPGAKATESNCEIFTYTVAEGDTPGSVSSKYNVPWDAIRQYNGIPGDIVQLGQTLKIPLCKRNPTPGPTSTPTPPPPYAAPSLLLPADGTTFASGDTVTLQWSSVGTLRQNESYAITIEDLTDGSGKKVVDYVTDTKYIVPATLRPAGTSTHIFRWTVLPVRQSGTTKDGQPIYDQGGAQSTPRVFGWIGGGSSPAPTSNP